MGKKNDINKGLRALLSNIESANTPPAKEKLVKKLSSNIATIAVASIEANPFQPRTEFVEEELENLVQSIKTHGLIQPITVRSLGGDKFQLISGERRWRASQRAGLKEVPAYIRLANDQEMLEMALVENIQRADLNAMEVAISYQRLMDECNLTHEALSDRVGKNRSTITNYVRLLKLPPQIQQAVKAGDLSMGHARALAGIENVSLQLEVFKKTIDQGLSVRATEALIASFAKKKGKTSPEKDALTNELISWKDKMMAKYGTRIDIKRNAKGQGKLSIQFNNDDELNTLMDALS